MQPPFEREQRDAVGAVHVAHAARSLTGEAVARVGLDHLQLAAGGRDASKGARCTWPRPIGPGWVIIPSPACRRSWPRAAVSLEKYHASRHVSRGITRSRRP